MAYLTLVVNPADDIAAKRVVNVPRRGIGKTTIERIDQYGREMNMPFLTAAELAVVDPDIRASTRNAVGEFIQVIKDGATYGGDLRKVVEMIIDKAGLIRALQDEGTDEARGRVENIQEFLGVVDEFVQTHDAEESDFAAPTVGEDESAEARARTARRLAGRFHRMGAPAHRSGHGDRGRAGRHPHDRALVQGPGIRLRLGGRHGGDPVPPHELRGRRGGRGGGAAPRLCGHHSRPQAPVPYLRPATADFRPDPREPRLALHR